MARISKVQYFDGSVWQDAMPQFVPVGTTIGVKLGVLNDSGETASYQVTLKPLYPDGSSPVSLVSDVFTVAAGATGDCPSLGVWAATQIGYYSAQITLTEVHTTPLYPQPRMGLSQPDPAHPTLRAFVLVPKDRPFQLSDVSILSGRWQMGVNWISDQLGRRVNAVTAPEFINVPDTYNYLYSLAVAQNIIPYANDAVVAHVGHELPVPPTDRWFTIVRGGGGLAGSNGQYGKGFIGDVMIESVLGHPDAVIDMIFPDWPFSAKDAKRAFVTPDAQTGAMVHEMCLTLGASDMSSDGVMSSSWGKWPDVPIEDAAKTAILMASVVLP